MRVLFIPLLLLSLNVFCQITGKVVSVADGDTFTLLTAANKQIRIRLHGIDCPEKKQDYGTVAKAFLSELVFGKQVSVKQKNIDRYGRTIGMVTVGGVNVNEALLMAGLAWHYKYYDHNPKWAEMENQARAEKKGLWVKSDAIQPWEFRKAKRQVLGMTF